MRQAVWGTGVLLFTLSLLGRAGTFTIVLHPGAGLSGNASALNAIQESANFRDTQSTDPIPVDINVGLQNMGNSTMIGSANAFAASLPHATIRTALTNDALASPETTDDVDAFLPATFSAHVPADDSVTGYARLTTASAKALGFSYGGTDATKVFNSMFSFYCGTRTPPAGQMNLYGVALHEIAHGLGFISTVDDIPGNPVTPYVLDLFRFAPADVPTTPAQFQANLRTLIPGASADFSDVANVYAMSTGATHQASHWLADEISGNYIGVMDPGIVTGVLAAATSADIQALNVIGWNLAVVPVPEPATWAGLGVGLIFILSLSQRRTGR